MYLVNFVILSNYITYLAPYKPFFPKYFISTNYILFSKIKIFCFVGKKVAIATPLGNPTASPPTRFAPCCPFYLAKRAWGKKAMVPFGTAPSLTGN